MTASTVLQSTIHTEDVSTPTAVTLPPRRCCLCPDRPARPGSWFCDPCASAYWDYLRSMDPSRSLPSLESIRAYVYARRDEKRQRQFLREKRARQQLAPVAMLPVALLLDAQLRNSVVALRVYGALAALGADARWIPYNAGTIAESLGYNRRTVLRALDKLITRGYVAKERDLGNAYIRCRVGGQP